ncbi:MAG: tetratricopeptide repeat protein [Cyclobacteriaceae bacterium]|nr:tetratricopeptide repeat protein [Cyclobacteriaceae bacterium]
MIRIALMISILFKSIIAFSQHEESVDSLNYYIKKKDKSKIIEYYEKLIKSNPRATGYILYKGAYLYNFGMYKEAIVEFSKAIEINPNLIDAYVRRANTYMALLEYDSSIIDFTRAVGKHTYQDSIIYKYRAVANFYIGNYQSVITDCDSALWYNAFDKEIYSVRASAKMKIKDFKGALADFNSAIQIDKDYLIAIQNRIFLYIENGNINIANIEIDDYIKTRPKDLSSNFFLGHAYFNLKNYEKAIKYLDACKGKLNTLEFHKIRGLTNYYLVNDYEAIKDLEITLKFNLTNSDKAMMYYAIGVCKNNIQPQSGCTDLIKSLNTGVKIAKQEYDNECK